MPTREEAAAMARRYRGLYEEAIRARNQADKSASDCKARKRSIESSLSDCRTEKNSLEARRDAVKAILSHFDNNTSYYVNKANRSAKTAGEKYVTAIKCDTISSASLETTFHTKTVSEDPHLSSAYTDCYTEMTRLETAIETINAQIQKYDLEMNSLEAQISAFTKSAQMHNDEARYYYRLANP